MKYGIYYQGKFVKIKDFRQLDVKNRIYALAETDEEKVKIKQTDGTEIIYDFFILERIDDVQDSESGFSFPRYQQKPCTNATLKSLVLQAIQNGEVEVPKSLKLKELYDYFKNNQ